MLYLNDQLQLVWVAFLEIGVHSKWRVKVSRNSIVHYYELALRRGDLQRLVELELRIVHALVEIEVIEHHFAAGGPTSYNDIVVEHKLQGGVPMQIALHLNAAVDARVYHVSACVEDHADLLINIHEYFVFLVLPHSHFGGVGADSIAAKDREGASDLAAEYGFLVLDQIIDYQGLNKLGGSQLRLPEVDYFV